MQDETQLLIKKLNVIGDLTPGKTISTSNPEEWCILDHKSWSSSLWRTYAGEGRESGIHEISKVFKSVLSLLSKTNTIDLLELLEKALVGFDTLKETYKDDYNATASIVFISNKTREQYNWFMEEYKTSKNTQHWDFPDSNVSTESSVSEQSIEIEDKRDWSEECIKDAFVPKRIKTIPGGFLNQTITESKGMPICGKSLFRGPGPMGLEGSISEKSVFEDPEWKMKLGPMGRVAAYGLTGTIGSTGPIGTNTYGVGPNKSLSKPEEAFSIDPCGKKNSLDCQQSIDQSSSPLVENTNRSLCNEEDNKNSIIDSEECSNRSSNESFVLDNKPYYDRKKKVPSEHISGYNMPDVSFRTWLHKE